MTWWAKKEYKKNDETFIDLTEMAVNLKCVNLQKMKQYFEKVRFL